MVPLGFFLTYSGVTFKELKMGNHFLKVKDKISRFGLDGFLLGLIAMIFLAWLWPAAGIQTGILSLKEAANFGVSLIFFFYGLRLSPEKLKSGLSNWRLHLVVQISTFLVFPLIMLLVIYFFGSKQNELLWLGVFYVAALPSTVSSSVVMVSIAKGNVPSAIFNASISSLIGVFITPLWMGLYLSTSTGSFDFSSIIVNLIIQILVPVCLGILLHSRFGWFAEQHKKGLRVFDQSIILLIIFTSFCASFASDLFSGMSVLKLVVLGVSMIGLFFFMFFLIRLICKLFRFNREDSITAIFCGSKKSLVHGTVMSKVLFQHTAGVGIIILPLMIYHALQLIAASVIAQRMAREAK
jgi:sodium/bile acid cotransporter 7